MTGPSPAPHPGEPLLATVAVVGLGTIGGSLARDLAAGGVRVLGYDADPETLGAAHAEGVLHHVLDASLHGAGEADALVVAVPVARAPEVLACVAARPGRLRLVTDAGSTKRGIVAAAERLGLGPRFVGAHPLAGDHRSGWRASRTGLFRGAPVYLCPSSSASAEALELSRRLWDMVGGRVELIDASEHDHRLAWTSHLPQTVSTTLALALADAGITPADLGPGGRDMTRLAGSSPDMWTGIAVDNADQIAGALGTIRDRLDQLHDALTRRDETALRRMFSEGWRWSPESLAEPT